MNRGHCVVRVAGNYRSSWSWSRCGMRSGSRVIGVDEVIRVIWSNIRVTRVMEVIRVTWSTRNIRVVRGHIRMVRSDIRVIWGNVRVAWAMEVIRVLRVDVAARISVLVVEAVGVVGWIHRAWEPWTEAVIVEANLTRTDVEEWTRSDVGYHPWLFVITSPVDAERLEVLESCEAVQLIVLLVIWHHHIGIVTIQTIGCDGDVDPLDLTRSKRHIFLGIVVIIGIEINVYVAFVCIVSNILDIIVDRNRIGVVGQHGL